MKELDVFLGKKLRKLRHKIDLPLKSVAAELGISLQQLQRYELGLNRIPAALLYQIQKSFSVPVAYFFEGLEEETDLKNENRKLNLLLIEDNEADEFLIRKALEDYSPDLNIYALHNGEKAMQFFREIPDANSFDLPIPDMIFLDLHLPFFDGIEILKNAKRRLPLQKIPIVILTNSLNSEDMKKSYQFQASGFIRKSFVFEEFRDNLRQALDYWTKTVVMPPAPRSEVPVN